MKKIYLYLLISIVFIVTANAQMPLLKWAKTFNGKDASTDSTSILKMYNLDKSIYIAGTSDAYGTNNDIVLIKRDYATGDTLWTRHYNGPANSDDQAVDMVINQATGDVYITGKSLGTGTGYDIVTLKYSPSGVLDWVERWDNASYHGDDIPKNIGIDNTGKIYVSAYTFDGNTGYPVYYDDLLVLVYSSLGSLTNSRIEDIGEYGINDDLVGGAIVNNNGDIFIGGENMFGTINNGFSKVFVYGMKSDLSSFYPSSWGNTSVEIVQNWAFIWTPDDFNFYNAMSLDNTNNVYIASLMDTIPHAGTYFKIVFTKIDNTGNILWQKKIDGNENYKNLRVNSIKVAPNNLNVYAVGYEKSSSGNFDWFIIKYNSDGVFQWRANKDGGGHGNDKAYGLAFDNQQNPIVVGFTKNISGNDDITLVKYDKTNGSELYSVNYNSGNGDDKAYNIDVDANQDIIINGVENTTTQSQNMIALRYYNPVAAAGVITGDTTVYQGQDSVTYTVPKIDYATSYIWTLPSGATGTSNTNSISVNFSNTATSGNISVKGYNDGGDGAASSIAITVSVPPRVSTLSPADNASGVVVSSNLVITFNENILKGTGNILIKDVSDDSLVQTIDVTTSAVSITNNAVTINPPNDLLRGKNYYILIPSTAFTDTSSNPYAGISDKTTWNFATELKMDPTLTFANITKIYGDSGFDLAATSNSTGTVSYSIIGEANGTILSGTNNKTVTLGNVGSVTLRASVAADANYNAFTKDITLTISAKSITITADAKTKVYGETDPSLTYQVTTGTLVGSDVLTGSLSRAAGEDVGSYAISSTLANSNYTITYVSADLNITAKSITVTADAKTKVYGETDPSLTYQITSGTLVGTDILTGSLSRAAGEDVGSYAISSTLANSNYTITFVSAYLNITAKSITVTADAKTKVYGETDPSLTYQITTGTLVGSDVLIGSLSRAAGEDVGSYAISSTLANSNYTITYVSADLNITAKSIKVTADAKTKVYGETDPSLTYQITSGALVGSDVLTGSLSRSAGEDVGSYAISSTLANSNYTITFVSAFLNITAKAITITADTKTKVYGEADPSLTYQITTGSLVGTDALTGSLSRAAGEDVGSYAINQNTLTAGYNYTITYVGAFLNITAAAVQATTLAATSLTTNGAVLNGTIYVGGDQTTVVFEYGLTSNLSGSNTTTAALQSPLSASAGTVSVSLELTGLSDGTTYYFRVKGTNSMGTIIGSILSFTTLDGTPPTVTTLSPADNATGVTSSNLEITFSESVQKGIGNILIKKSSDDAVIDSIDVTSSKVSVNNATVTLNLSPTLTLPSNTELYVQIPKTAFTDLSRNAFAGILDKTGWNFTTGTVLGIKDVTIKGFSIYPNPTSGLINFTSQEEPIEYIQVFNMNGKLIIQKKIKAKRGTINLSSLPKGTYFVRVFTKDKSNIVKLIKQ